MHHRRILAAQAFNSIHNLPRNHQTAHPHPHLQIQIHIPTLVLSRRRQHRPYPCPHSCPRSFHTTRPLGEDNHYSTLESTPDASAGHLKKQFYALSKRHHPDLHPDDSAAAQRFVRISTAWSVLGNASKRAVYDREMRARDPAAFGGSDNSTHSAHAAAAAPHGSHSSAQAQAWGARPASGLSRRRGSFRGPPPSFYRSGGWGGQEGKRRAAAEGAESAAHRAETAGATAGNNNGGSNGGGFAPGQGYEHADYEIPHFDRAGHFRRQEGVQETLRKRRVIWAEREAVTREQDDTSSGTGERILLVSSVLATTAVMGWIWERRVGKTKDR